MDAKELVRIVRDVIEDVKNDEYMESVFSTVVEDLRAIYNPQEIAIIELRNSSCKVRSSRGLSYTYIKELHRRGCHPLFEYMGTKKAIEIIREGHHLYPQGFENPYKVLVLVPVVVSGSLKAMLFMSFDREIDLGVGFEEEARLISDLLAIVSDYYRLKDVVDELERVDAITQVANFKAFHEELYREWIRARESGHTFALILVHVTGIKECNDILGHVRGDELLRFVANTVRSNVRSIDFVARYGSAKFAVILPETDKESAVKYAEKIRDSFSMSDWAKQKFPVYLDISVVAFPEDGEDEKVLLGKLESRLVEAMRKKGSDVIYK